MILVYYSLLITYGNRTKKERIYIYIQFSYQFWSRHWFFYLWQNYFNFKDPFQNHVYIEINGISNSWVACVKCSY